MDNSHKLILIIGIVAIAVGGYLYPRQEVQEPVGTAFTQAVAGNIYRLSGSGVTKSASSVGIREFKQPVSGVKLQIGDFGTIGFATLEPGSQTKKEFISFTGVTQNGDGSATLTGVVRGLGFVDPYTASSTLELAHSGGSRL